MTVQDAFAMLVHSLRQLDEALAHLEWAVSNGPPDPQQAPVGELHDRVTALRGAVAEARASIGRVRTGAPTWSQLAPARQALVDCQRHVNVALSVYYGELATPAVKNTLQSLMASRKRGAADHSAPGRLRTVVRRSDWSGWAYGVGDALESCIVPIGNLNEALTQCWRELADHTDPPAVLVRTEEGFSAASAAAETPY